MRQRTWLRAIWALALISTMVATATAEAARDPSQVWRTIETSHFIIHYEQLSEDLAYRVAVLAEETYDQIVPIYGDTAGERTHVVIIRDVDTANGSARVVPYNLIRVYDMAPPVDSTLGDTDDWLRLLFLHEYIHILHMNVVSGIWTYVNMVFGKTVMPNQMLPRWYIEGLAVYGETAFTEGGRLRNNAYRMYLRMDALHNNLRDVEHWAGVPVRWPMATGWYLYGGDFVDYVIDQYSLEQWLEFNDRIGGALSPLSVNAQSVEVFGVDMLALWDAYITTARAEFTAEAVAVRAQGETDVELLTDGGFFSGYPRCRDPHTIGYVNDDGNEQRHIVTTALADGETESWLDVYGSGSFDWLPNGESLVFTQSGQHENFYHFNDLYLYDRQRDVVRRLTNGERAREPAVSPDGRFVAYIAQDFDGGVDLRELDMVTGETRTLYDSRNNEVVSTPDYSPDGRSILFSLWLVGWARDLYLLDRETESFEQLTDDRARDLEGSFTPDGQTILFSSDRTGIFNIYSLDLATREVAQRTNVIGGVFAPRQCAPDGPVFVRTYQVDGYDVGLVTDFEPRPASPSYDRPVVDYPELTADEVVLEERRYQAWRDLYPRSWSPILSEDSGGFVIGATVSASDPVPYHYYTANLTYGVSSGRIGAGFRYTYAGLPADISAFVSRSERDVTSRLIAESRYIPFEQEEISAGLSLLFPFWDERSSQSFLLSWTFRRIRMLDMPDIEHDPGDIQPIYPEEGRFDDISIGWFWGDARSYAYSLGLETGSLLSLFVTLRSPITGADYDSIILSWAYRQYFAMPWLTNHSVAFMLTGGIGRAAYERRPLFSVGGFPDQDIVLALKDLTPMGAGFLRGYPPHVQIGSQFHKINSEYRMPLWIVDTGAWTLPVFIRRLYLAAFVDAGTAVDEWEGFSSWLVGVGAEIRIKTTLGFIMPADFRIGYARGLMEGGINDFYVFYGGTF